MERGGDECKDNTHRIRENKFGISWCVKCGRLFGTAIDRKKLNEEDKKYYERIR